MTVPCLRVPRSEGEAVRRELAAEDRLAREYRINGEGDWLYIPIQEGTDPSVPFEVVRREPRRRETQTMPADLVDPAPSYERVGDIAIIDEDDLTRAEAVADAIVDSDLPLATVVNKESKVKGAERTREWTLLRGDSTETVHREYGYEFRVDLRTVYFSPRLATERRRVVTRVEPDERVFDMFAGVGPFSIPMADRGASMVATDLNAPAIEYLRENADRNDVADGVEAINVDVRELDPKYRGTADRIVMNLPHSADQFLDTAFALASDRCVIHYYDITSAEEPFSAGERAIRSAAPTAVECEWRDREVVRSYSPTQVNSRIDVAIRRGN